MAISVSALVPVYNGMDTLDRCLASLHAQGSPLVEILLIDDGSRDGSPARLHAFATTESRAVVLEHGTNQGLSRTLNEGIARARGDAVLIVHQDCELQGTDWVARAAAFSEGHPKTVVTGSPVYPLSEMNRTEVAFGLLRDTFFVSPEPMEELTFSEFKCDLLPRDATRGSPFDERFRASGEDQVFSMQLAAAGYRIARVRDLAYNQRFGMARTVGSQLRKEVSYGTTEGGILLRTSFRVARESSSSRTSGRRLANRASVLLVGLALLAFVILLLAGAGPWLAALVLLLLVPRIAMIVGRALRLRSAGRGPPGALALALVLFVPNDIAYAAAVLRGAVVYAVRHRV